MSKLAEKFAGFPLDTFKFLDELEKNNHRDWFEEHRDRYESAVRGPALAWIESMQEPISRLAPSIRVEAKKVGGSLMRIHRDTRFSSNKLPYKTNVGIQFRHSAGKDVHAPGFYFHIDTESVFVATGIWHPDSTALNQIRQRIDKRQSEWQKIVSDRKLLAHFEQSGDSLKRPPRGYDKDHPLIDDLKRKDHILVASLNPEIVHSKNLPTRISRLLERTIPYLKFLCNSLRLKL